MLRADMDVTKWVARRIELVRLVESVKLGEGFGAAVVSRRFVCSMLIPSQAEWLHRMF
ncbi:MAG: hypothetical protein MUC43_20245 [Pirellula sp.]|nr:hypothetical protein [Pirellula sp.]